jgi:hypothetical protein
MNDNVIPDERFLRSLSREQWKYFSRMIRLTRSYYNSVKGGHCNEKIDMTMFYLAEYTRFRELPGAYCFSWCNKERRDRFMKIQWDSHIPF